MQISEHLHTLRLHFEVPLPSGPLPRFVDVYLVYGDNVWLIDAGVAGAEATIREYLRQTGRGLEEVALLLLTHAHPDHVGAAAALQRLSGCEVAVHEAERAWVEDVQRQERERPVPGFSVLVGGSAPVTRVLRDGDLLSLQGDLTLEVLHTPGHSPGSVSLLLREEGALFTGDVVPAPGDLPIYDDPRLLDASLRRLQALEGVRVMLSAWDQPRWGQEIGERLAAARDYLQRIDTVVRAAAAQTVGDDRLCERVVAELGLPPGAANPLVARSLAAHLRHDSL